MQVNLSCIEAHVSNSPQAFGKVPELASLGSLGHESISNSSPVFCPMRTTLTETCCRHSRVSPPNDICFPLLFDLIEI